MIVIPGLVIFLTVSKYNTNYTLSQCAIVQRYPYFQARVKCAVFNHISKENTGYYGSWIFFFFKSDFKASATILEITGTFMVQR